jgi:hypothetical protein
MQENRPLSRTIAVVPGLIIGVLWIAMAIAALWTSARGYANGRTDWGLGWGLVGFFLLAGGIAAAVGTWWHNFRVVSRHHH